MAPIASIRTRVQGTEASRTIRILLVAEQEDAVQLNDLLEAQGLLGRLDLVQVRMPYPLHAGFIA